MMNPTRRMMRGGYTIVIESHNPMSYTKDRLVTMTLLSPDKTPLLTMEHMGYRVALEKITRAMGEHRAIKKAVDAAQEKA